MVNGMDIGSLSFDALIAREWLATNQLGGYASSSVTGLNTRKYHGLLVAAMAPPVRRMVLLSRMDETVMRDGWPNALSCNEYPGVSHPEGHRLAVPATKCRQRGTGVSPVLAMPKKDDSRIA